MICGDKMVRIILRDDVSTQGIVDTEEVEDIEEIQESYDSVGVDSDEIRVEGVAEFDEESFDDYLDEIYGDFIPESYSTRTLRESERMGVDDLPIPRFRASRVLKVLDPTMYRMLQSEHEDFLLEQARDELRDKAEDEEERNWVDNIFRNFL